MLLAKISSLSKHEVKLYRTRQYSCWGWRIRISYSQMTVPQMLSAVSKWAMINYPTGPVKSFPHPQFALKTPGINDSMQTVSHMEIVKNYLNLSNNRKPEKWWSLRKMLLFLDVLSGEVAFYLNYDRDGTCIFYVLELTWTVPQIFFMYIL